VVSLLEEGGDDLATGLAAAAADEEMHDLDCLREVLFGYVKCNAIN
jgi:hypothetical protein